MGPLPLQGLEQLFSLALNLVAVLFVIVWTSINFYTHFPLFQQLAEAGAARLGTLGRSSRATGSESVARPEPESLPTMTVLVPAYDEADVVENAIASVYEASYPRDRLSVYALVEPDDDATQEALAELSSDFPHETLVVPAAYPGDPNKPRAINYGFEHATGDIVGVVDAEVIVDEALLERAATEISGDADFALSHLDMVNEDDGWLNLLFRAEYGYWYNDVVPAFTDVDYPVPLGGTSCFFERDVLTAISERRQRERGSPWSAADREWLRENGLEGLTPWDPTNVTEDFELGFYLWTNGYEFAYLDVVTREESPVTLQNWMEQRTRWKKGKLYTFRRFVDNPPETLWQKAHVYTQSLVPHLGPINIAGLLFVFWLATMTGAVQSLAVTTVLALGMTFLVMVSVLFARGYWVASETPLLTRLRRTCIVGLSVFVYWTLQWIADVRALIQTYRGEFDWVKTDHLGRNAAPDAALDREGTDAVLTSGDDDAAAASNTLSRRWRVGGLASVLVVALLTRVAGLTRWSLWLDEVYTISFRATIPLREALVVPYDPHPPLYFVLLHLWMDVGGRTQAVAALFSVTFSVASVGMLYLFTKRLYEDRTALLAASFLALSTVHIHFGRNVRMYSLLTFLALASWYAFVHLNRESRWYGVAYLVATTALLYTHVYAISALMAQQVYGVLTETEGGFQRRWLGLQIAVGVLYSPWLAVLGWQVLGRFTGRGATAIGWIPEPSTALLRDTLLLFAGFPSFYPIFGGSPLSWGLAVVLLLACNVVVLWSIVVYRPTDDEGYEYELADIDQASLLGVFFLVPVAVPFVVSYLVFPIYFPRYTILASLPLLILVARGVRNLQYQRPWQTAFLALFVVTAAVSGAGYYGGDSVEDWRGVVNGFEEDVERSDLVVVQPAWVESQLRYYYDGPSVSVLPVSGEDEAGESNTRIANQSGDAETVWVVRYQQPEADGILTRLNETHELAETTRDGVITVYEYRRTGNGEPTNERYAATFAPNPLRKEMAAP